MRRLLATVLLALLPLQFSWAAVASYCAHEATADATHFGHHEHRHHAHQHHADRGLDAESAAELHATTDAAGDPAPGALHLDCGHCHGHCSAMVSPTSGLPETLSTARPSATLDAAGQAHAPARPERPQWLRLA